MTVVLERTFREGREEAHAALSHTRSNAALSQESVSSAVAGATRLPRGRPRALKAAPHGVVALAARQALLPTVTAVRAPTALLTAVRAPREMPPTTPPRPRTAGTLRAPASLTGRPSTAGPLRASRSLGELQPPKKTFERSRSATLVKIEPKTRELARIFERRLAIDKALEYFRRADTPRRRVAATPRLGRGRSVATCARVGV